MGWASDLDEIIQTQYKSFVGTCIGTVVSTSPLKIEIMSGDIMLEGDNFYVCEHITEHKMDMSVAVETENHTLPPCTEGGGHVPHKHTVHVDGIREVHNALDVGDNVLVCSTEDNQTYFVVDRLVRGDTI